MKSKIQKLLLVVLATAVLAACAPAIADPYTLRDYADGAINATEQARRARMQETQLALAEIAQNATLQAAQARDLAQATQAAHSMQATQTVQEWQAIAARSTATQHVANSLATQAANQMHLAETQASIRVTQTVLAVEATHVAGAALAQERRSQFWDVMMRLTGIVLVAAISMAVTRFLWMLPDWLIEWRNRRNSLIETRTGTVAFVDDGNGLIPMLLMDVYHNRYRPLLTDARSQLAEAPRVEISCGGMATPGQNGDTTARLVELLLRDAMVVSGGNTDQIPGWRQLRGWNSENWQRAVRALQAASVVETREGVGTFVVRHECLADLLDAVRKRQVKVRPTPLAGAPGP